jgi:hypothetical protein
VRSTLYSAMKALKLYLGIGLVLLALYVGKMLVPPYFNSYLFDDWIADESYRGSYVTGRTEAEIRAAVINKAREYDINLSPEQLRVEAEGRKTRITATYAVRVAWPLYPVDLHFTSDHEVIRKKNF